MPATPTGKPVYTYVVLVPDKELKLVSPATENSHVFVRKGIPTKIEFQVLRTGRPVRSARYLLEIDGKLTEGQTDENGRIQICVTPEARLGNLRVQDGRDELVYHLKLGSLNPLDTPSGYQARLENLGYSTAPDPRGEPDGGMRRALVLFQEDHDLPATGEFDAATLKKVKAAHGS